MLSRSSPIRFVLTLLLALAVPFCCCDLRSLLAGCVSVGAKSESRPVAADRGEGTEQGHATHCRCHSSATDPHHGSTPEKGPGEDQHDCPCGKNTGKMLTVAQATFDLPAPVAVAILDWSGSTDLRPPASFRVRDIEQRAVGRPQTSLLRMHCALVV
ncbi:MAG: hypothetical protein IT438_16225 [Phycisphaerales bacterium]|nr:hypothetical protein [Phycisphaerales bacterium]